MYNHHSYSHSLHLSISYLVIILRIFGFPINIYKYISLIQQRIGLVFNVSCLAPVDWDSNQIEANYFSLTY